MNEEITNLKDKAVENVAGGWGGEYANYTYEQFSGRVELYYFSTIR